MGWKGGYPGSGEFSKELSRRELIMNHVLLSLTVSTVAVSLLLDSGCASSPLTTKVEQPSLLVAAKSIAVRDFLTDGAKVIFDGRVDSLGRVMAAYVCAKIREKSDELEVVLDTTGFSDTDITIEGKFTEIDEGSEAGRVLIGSGGATVAVSGIIRSRDGTIVADFTKSKTSAGGPIGLGGILSGTGREIIDDNMEEIAEDLADFIFESRGP